MAAHVDHKGLSGADFGQIADETWRFLINKVKKLYIYYVAAVLLQVIIRFVLIKHESFFAIIYRFLQGIPAFTLTFVDLSPSEGLIAKNAWWFLSSLLIAMFILYPFLLRNFRFASRYVFPLVSFLVLGYLYNTKKSVSIIFEWSGFMYYGTLRALAEVALGGSLYSLTELMCGENAREMQKRRPAMKTILTICKLFCYILVIAFAYGNVFGMSFKPGFNLHALLFCSLGILLSFSNAGFCIPDNAITRLLGKLSLPIYIFHGNITSVLAGMFKSSASIRVFIACVIATLIGSIALMYLTDFLFKGLKRITVGK